MGVRLQGHKGRAGGGAVKTAVILCAGTGSRLKPLTESVPKPLVKVAGREILYRTVRLLQREGIERFVLVVNPQNREAIERFLGNMGVEYTTVVNEHPERENGHSLLLAEPAIEEERFVLTMGDHIYSGEFISRAVKGEGLVVDELGLYTDKEEATKVLCEDGRVRDIGKSLARFNGYDTGFFVLDRSIFSAVGKVEGRITLSELVRRAGLRCSFVSGEFWTDVDTPEDLEKARREIVRASVKGTGDGFVSRHLNRKLSLWLSEKLVDRITPNQATWGVFAVGMLSALLALINPAAGGILYQISSMLDGIDGEIARASMRTTRFGGWLDSVLDRFVDFSFLSALALWLKPSPAFLLWVLLALFGSLMVSYTTERFRGAYQEDAHRALPALRGIPGKRDERILLTALMCLFGWVEALFVVLALVTNFRVLFTLYLVWREKGREEMRVSA